MTKKSIAWFTESERLVAAERLFARITIDDETGCLLFNGTTNWSGYGVVSLFGIGMLAHRLAHELKHGPIPQNGRKTWVLHKCDTPACCNPEHLYLGGPAENSRDMADRTRMRKGCRVMTPGGMDPEYEKTPVGTVFYEYQGEIRPLAEWSEIFGVNSCTLDSRFRSGWPPENIQRPPVLGFKNWPKRSEARHSYRRFSGQKAVAEYINSQGVEV